MILSTAWGSLLLYLHSACTRLGREWQAGRVPLVSLGGCGSVYSLWIAAVTHAHTFHGLQRPTCIILQIWRSALQWASRGYNQGYVAGSLQSFGGRTHFSRIPGWRPLPLSSKPAGHHVPVPL